MDTSNTFRNIYYFLILKYGSYNNNIFLIHSLYKNRLKKKKKKKKKKNDNNNNNNNNNKYNI
ncbi:hypothetical protein PFFVO_05430 [Plasmodium falciparum Vietnam Oak-Knoll (FVO)]|uniref:Uncharacterized protein n=1 Tax=Plasmodium falciparum Vietnam Oak-Knoll (FVO) TaxID=1036723 RepID=A0A024V0C0_PLAFA|nr:hypothetical protein PFFVO_05430 [Plasmodium falciparum Vietnam Oak-Knoll (FVO)]